jgi:arabinose operon protein AraL
VNKPEIKAVLFDLDGTLYLGENLIPEADWAVGLLRSRGIKVTFLTNKPIASPQSYADKLSGLGIKAGVEDVITSVRLTTDYLTTHYPEARVYVIGESYLNDTLTAGGFRRSERPEETNVVILSLDRCFEYSKLDFAYRAVKAGAHVVATNPDALCPMNDGEIIDAGAWIAALETLIKRPIDAVLGKPSRRCADLALSVMGFEAREVLMVGDRLETDIRMAQLSGMQSALVLSGVTTQRDLERSSLRPDHILTSVAEIPEVIGLT